MVEEPTEGLEDPPAEIAVVGLVEQLAEEGHAEHDPGALHRPLGEIIGEAVKRPEIAHQHQLPHRGEQVDAGEEVGVVRLAGVAEVVGGDLHDLHDRPGR
ncbi:MAG: hypothetical protein ACK559_00130, partial [bacterium]